MADLRDRTSRPLCSTRQTSTAIVAQIERLRRLRWNGWRIAHELELRRGTVISVLHRRGLNRLRSLDPPSHVVRS